jgi:hypothetical protein
MRTTSMRRIYRLCLCLLAGWVWQPAGAAEVEAGMLVYRVETPGEPDTISRLLTTPDYLRLDQGEADQGFILFDRRERVIYSVNPAEHSILEIDPPAANLETPADLNIEMKPVTIEDAPAVGGVKPVHWQLLANGGICREAILAPGLMPKSVAAYREYLLLLASQQAVSLQSIPEEFQSACDSALNVYAPDALLEKGLPLRLWDAQGYQEVLTEFKPDGRFPAEYFTLPAGYEHVPMGAGF